MKKERSITVNIIAHGIFTRYEATDVNAVETYCSMMRCEALYSQHDGDEGDERNKLLVYWRVDNCYVKFNEKN